MNLIKKILKSKIPEQREDIYQIVLFDENSGN